MWERLVVTPIMEHSDWQHPGTQKYEVHLHFKIAKFDHVHGEITYIKDPKGERFLDNRLTDFMVGLSDEDILEVHDAVRQEIATERRFNNLIPLRQFLCDKCGKVGDVNDMCIQYWHKATVLDGRAAYVLEEMQLVHYDKCTWNDEAIRKRGAIKLLYDLSGTEGLASLLGLCETDNFTDELSNKSYPSLAMEIVKRVQIPYYEEARFYPDVMKHVAATLDWPHQIYLRENLRHVVIRAKTPEEELQAERERQKAIYNDLKARGWIADPMEFLE